MKKALNVSIGGSIFYIEEDAYEELQEYLDAIKAHFSRFPDNNEIVSDMEARIAERLRMKKDDQSGTVIVTRDDVAALIEAMGSVADFQSAESGDGESSDRTETKSGGMGKRRFMRDSEDKILFGVCSGLGKYFGVDPLGFRIGFVVATLLWGWGILVYLILWLVTQEAKTHTEKMEMRGEPITIAALEEEVRDLAKRHKDDKSVVKNFVAKVFAAIGSVFTFVFKTLFPILGSIIGSIFVGAFGLALLGLLISHGNVLVNAHSPYIDIPLYASLGAGMYYPLAIALFLTVFIPVLALFFLSLAMVRRQSLLPKNAATSLVVLWFVAASAAGTLTVKSLPTIQSAIASDPAYALSSRSYPIDNFTGIKMYDGLKVSVEEGEIFSVSATGTEAALTSLNLAVENGTLVARRTNEHRICIICFRGHSSPTVRITMPRVERLEAHDAASVTTGLLAGESITIVASDAGRVQGRIIIEGTTEIEINDAGRVTLTGVTNTLNAAVSDAGRLSVAELVAQTVRVTATDASRAEVRAEAVLNAQARDASRITYRGNPAVTESARGASRIEAIFGETGTTTEAVRTDE